MKRLFLILSLAFIFLLSSCGSENKILRDDSGNDLKYEYVLKDEAGEYVVWILCDDGYCYKYDDERKCYVKANATWKQYDYIFFVREYQYLMTSDKKYLVRINDYYTTVYRVYFEV